MSRQTDLLKIPIGFLTATAMPIAVKNYCLVYSTHEFTPALSDSTRTEEEEDGVQRRKEKKITGKMRQ